MHRLRTVTYLDVSAVAGHHAMPAALLLSYIFGFREKRREHISLLAFETNFLKQDHCDNNKTDACGSQTVDFLPHCCPMP